MSALFTTFSITQDPCLAHSTCPCFSLADAKQADDIGTNASVEDYSLQINKLSDMLLIHLENDFFLIFPR